MCVYVRDRISCWIRNEKTMRIVTTYGGRDRIVNDSLLNFEAISIEFELILLGVSIVCCFNLITAFTDLSFRNAILVEMMQLNWLMKPIYPNLLQYRLMSTEWQSLYSPNVEIKVISITIASHSIINSIDYVILLYKPLSCLQSLNDRHLSQSHPS